MIGWWIVVSAQAPEARDCADEAARAEAILAQWEVGAGGLFWIQHLVAEGKATQHAHSGYPNRYTAAAGDVLPLIDGGGIRPAADGPWIVGCDMGEEYAQPPGWMGTLTLYRDRAAACPAGQLLTIDAWDQS